MASRAAEGKNHWATRTWRVVQGGFQTYLAITFADSPNGCRITINLVAQLNHLAVWCGTPQQNLSTPSNGEWRLTISQ
jgi:hypothetical protein